MAAEQDPIDLSDVEIGPYRPGDEHEILRVFEKVFGWRRSVEAWNWQYRDNPAGIHCFLARLPDGQVLSQFTGIPRRVRVGDRDVCFSEIVDSFTDPDYRQGLKKPGLFATTCYRYVDHYGRPDREIIMYGLPNPMAFRVGKALLGYVPFYKVELMTRDLQPDPGAAEPAPAGNGRLMRVEHPSEDTDALFERLAPRYGVLTVRRREYLDWRYARRPGVDYDIRELRAASGELCGLIVLRHGWLDQPVSVIADWLVDREHPLSREAVRGAEALAARAGSTRIQAFFPPGSPESSGLAELGWRAEPSQWRLVARTYDRENLPLSWLKDSWYLTLGDFDIV